RREGRAPAEHRRAEQLFRGPDRKGCYNQARFLRLIHDPVEGVRSVVVGWVESSRPTGTVRGSVGLEDSTHPTDFGPDTLIRTVNQAVEQRAGPHGSLLCEGGLL